MEELSSLYDIKSREKHCDYLNLSKTTDWNEINKEYYRLWLVNKKRKY